jgi:cytochrome d ubiquinol oxidase subunit I
MTTAAAVTGARGVPVGYGLLAASYLLVACGLVWVLRRLARSPLDIRPETPDPQAEAGPRLEAV